ncbi:MAG: GNAT family N-acetyltransferase [Pseudomonadota bacterium]
MSVVIRCAQAGDGLALRDLIVALADHQGQAGLVTATAGELEEVLCSPGDHRGCLVAELDGVPVGLAYWYEVFTTFTGKSKLYLEDLVVSPQARGTGAGFLLMQGLANICVERGYPRFEWLALSENETGRKFYRRIGGSIKQGADTWHLPEAGIRALAEEK